MIILGIDPGYKRIGYGIIENHSNQFKLIKAGLLKIPAGDSAKTASSVSLEIKNLIDKFKPNLLALEKLYFSKNQKTALKVAEMRGVIALAATEKGLPIKEFTPNEIKSGIAGYGLADKKAVAKMVRLTLNEPSLRVLDDVSDALAAAIVASYQKF
ncbi:MAG: crossover junction endodeoxyribonuclease RuvC [Patescibacteria group bacterium]